MTVSDVSRHNAKHVVLESYDEVGYNFRMTRSAGCYCLVQLGRVESFH